MRTAAVALATLTVLVAFAGCIQAPGTDDGSDPTNTDTATGSTDTPSTTETEAPPADGPFRLVADGFTQPLVFAHHGTDTIYIGGRDGRIWTIKDGEVAPWADLRDRVFDGGLEQGLLGFAFHPEYADNGVIIVSYTRSDGDLVISRFIVEDDVLFKGFGNNKEYKLFERDSNDGAISQPYANHNGGHVIFGPQDKLYIGVGDGGSAFDPEQHGQRTDELLGTILRVGIGRNGAYTVPNDNPYLNEGTARSEIWAHGLRNPWRFSFDAKTNDLWIGDVGQNCFEEIDFQPASSQGGENYGWARYEGNHRPVPNCDLATTISGVSGYTFPVAEYTHDGGACSVTGGFVYRGDRVVALDGKYLYGDFCAGVIWSMAGPDATPVIQYETNFQISSFGEDAAGELYVLDFEGGAVYQIVGA